MRKNLYLSILAISIIILCQSFSPESISVTEIPDDVNKVLIASCYDCHSSDARNKDAREALNFEKWDDYRATKKIGLLGDICELVEKNKMPPEKYLDRNPDRKLTEKQKKLICDWTAKESAKLMEGK